MGQDSETVGKNKQKQFAKKFKTIQFKKQARKLLNPKILAAGALAVGMLLIVVFFINREQANTSRGSSSSSGKAKMILETSRQTVKSGDEFTVKIYSDSASVDVNAVQAAVVYDSKLIELKNIDSTKSNYPIQAYESHDSDSVEIARGAIHSVNAKKIVSEMQFVAKSPGEATINFKQDETVLVNASTSKNILHNDSFNSITIGVN